MEINLPAPSAKQDIFLKESEHTHIAFGGARGRR